MKTHVSRQKIALILIFAYYFNTVSSQENYLPGYIITLNNDSLHGYIDYRNWSRNPDKIFFKDNLNSNKQVYAPLSILAFGVLDECYESAIVKTEISPILTNELNFEAELKIQIDTCFLQAIVKGNKSLFFYLNDYGRDQFYIKKGSDYELLVYKKYLKKLPESDNMIENKMFVGQLAVYLQDYQDVQLKLKNISYKKRDLEKLFMEYYEARQSEISFHRKTEKLGLEYGVFAGASLTSIKFNGAGFMYLENGKFENAVNFTTGAFLDLIYPRFQRKLSIYSELMYSSYDFDVASSNYNNAEDQIHLQYAYLKINNMFRVKYPIAGAYLYLNAGISNGFVISELNKKKEVSALYGTTTGRAIDEIRKHEFGFIGGLGARYQKYSGEIRFESSDGMSKYLGLTSIVNRITFLLSYRF